MRVSISPSTLVFSAVLYRCVYDPFVLHYFELLLGFWFRFSSDENSHGTFLRLKPRPIPYKLTAFAMRSKKKSLLGDRVAFHKAVSVGKSSSVEEPSRKRMLPPPTPIAPLASEGAFRHQFLAFSVGQPLCWNTALYFACSGYWLIVENWSRVHPGASRSNATRSWMCDFALNIPSPIEKPPPSTFKPPRHLYEYLYK